MDRKEEIDKLRQQARDMTDQYVILMETVGELDSQARHLAVEEIKEKEYLSRLSWNFDDTVCCLRCVQQWHAPKCHEIIDLLHPDYHCSVNLSESIELRFDDGYGRRGW